ncbi:MAG: putative glycoside hydrolase [Endomicrobia bacterium]|nr:putative glycoside hydrolase [Endomicrobiia bacterium]
MKNKILCITLFCFLSNACNLQTNTQNEHNNNVNPKLKVEKPKYVRGIHLSAWVAGMDKYKKRFEPYLGRDKLNTLVIAVKEYEGQLYIDVPEIRKKYNTPTIPIPKIEQYLQELKSKGVYTIARIVVFKDNFLAKNYPYLAIKNPDGSVWKDYKGNSWTDPYIKEVWEYNIEVAKKAIEIGFEEIQFDYIRFPSDGPTKLCRYSQNHTSYTATAALVEFLKYAKEKLSPTPISIDVFGLTPSVNHDMGIGQRFLQMAEVSDFVSPMMYPSHYRKGEYGIPDPNKEPYKTVFRTVSDAKKLLGDQFYKLRPYLQDFSLGYKYGKEEVKAQIKACYDNGIFDWLLWDPKCLYNLEAIEEMTKFTPENYEIKISTNN